MKIINNTISKMHSLLERRKMLKKASAASSLDILINKTSPWASNWNEILLYLRGPGMRDPSLSVEDVIGLIDEIKKLRDNNFPYTTSTDKIREKIHG